MSLERFPDAQQVDDADAAAQALAARLDLIDPEDEYWMTLYFGGLYSLGFASSLTVSLPVILTNTSSLAIIFASLPAILTLGLIVTPVITLVYALNLLLDPVEHPDFTDKLRIGITVGLACLSVASLLMMLAGAPALLVIGAVVFQAMMSITMAAAAKAREFAELKRAAIRNNQPYENPIVTQFKAFGQEIAAKFNAVKTAVTIKIADLKERYTQWRHDHQDEEDQTFGGQMRVFTRIPTAVTADSQDQEGGFAKTYKRFQSPAFSDADDNSDLDAGPLVMDYPIY